MGLDITAYSHLERVGAHTDDWCQDEDHVRAFAYDSFPQSMRGIPDLTNRTIGGSAFLWGGCYALTDLTQTCDFQAGSYTGYGRWREDLSRQFNPDTEPEKPFYELIWFADNEGTIGPDAARDLLADFREHAGRYDPPQIPEWPDYYHEKYANWTRAFEMAADSGLVSFR